MATKTKTGWVITCPVYTTPAFRTEQAALNHLERIEAAGHCPEQHAIEARP